MLSTVCGIINRSMTLNDRTSPTLLRIVSCTPARRSLEANRPWRSTTAANSGGAALAPPPCPAFSHPSRFSDVSAFFSWPWLAWFAHWFPCWFPSVKHGHVWRKQRIVSRHTQAAPGRTPCTLEGRLRQLLRVASLDYTRGNSSSPSQGLLLSV